ncbi:MarR family transcriptional regulator [Sphingobium agri]|uniref:MarR family transcriptional regulator n=1 Tax=Sphingobium agri TaxID=2933566 RepID=A0ABT0E0B4_9SPHN|nr:MarR family transcriptional regulator [Sphingobium agri]MCK0532801.1 MarR family transcriptional regulator [Sphingobium agri]
MAKAKAGLTRYSESLAGTLLAAREAVMAPIRPILREANVTEQQWRVLRVLTEVDELDASSIAKEALLYAPTVTRILRELTERQWVVRSTDPNDGRRSVISISDEGRRLVQGTATYTVPMLSAYAEAFGEQRLRDFIAEARELAKALEPFSPDR